jgi:hypothetical protein
MLLGDQHFHARLGEITPADEPANACTNYDDIVSFSAI